MRRQIFDFIQHAPSGKFWFWSISILVLTGGSIMAIVQTMN